MHLARDLAALVWSANAVSTRPPVRVLRRPDHEMPLVPIVRNRQSRVEPPPQVAGALIPDYTQHSWRDDMGRELEKRVGGVRHGISG